MRRRWLQSPEHEQIARLRNHTGRGYEHEHDGSGILTAGEGDGGAEFTMGIGDWVAADDAGTTTAAAAAAERRRRRGE